MRCCLPCLGARVSPPATVSSPPPNPHAMTRGDTRRAPAARPLSRRAVSAVTSPPGLQAWASISVTPTGQSTTGVTRARRPSTGGRICGTSHGTTSGTLCSIRARPPHKKQSAVVPNLAVTLCAPFRRVTRRNGLYATAIHGTREGEKSFHSREMSSGSKRQGKEGCINLVNREGQTPLCAYSLREKQAHGSEKTGAWACCQCERYQMPSMLIKACTLAPVLSP